MPLKRIQRKRTPGAKLPQGAVYVGRPSRWGNPYRVGMPFGECAEVDRAQSGYGHVPLDFKITLEICLALYQARLERHVRMGWLDIAQLRGKNLACWCKLTAPCHADILLKLANR